MMKILLENWQRYINESANIDLDTVSKILEEAEIYGFGGECAETAIAINDVLFDSKAKIVAAVNKWIWETKGRMIGHVAVEWNETYWDAEGEKDWESIESWGMLDEYDEDYDFGDNPEENAYIVEKIYPTKDELLDEFGGCNLSKKKQILINIKNKHTQKIF